MNAITLGPLVLSGERFAIIAGVFVFMIGVGLLASRVSPRFNLWSTVLVFGGLAVAGHEGRIAPVVKALADAGIRVSLFIEPSEAQVEAAAAVGAQVVEFHTGRYCHLTDPAEREVEFERLAAAAAQADILGLEVHAGHGLDYDTAPRMLAISEIRELNIGHFLIGDSIFIGLDGAIRRMRAAMDAAK